MASPAYAWPWEKVRLAILERDGYRCQLRYDGCTGWATQVDHTIPYRKAPHLRLDPANLRSACRHCNLARRRYVPRWVRQRPARVRASRDW